MKVLITGCNGFVVKNFIMQSKEQHDIYGIGRKENTDLMGISYIQADVSNREELFVKVSRKCEKIDIIIHAAAELRENVESLYQTNCLGTQNVVDLAQKLHCKQFIYISSVPVIGVPNQLPVTEEHPVKPCTIYHHTKYFGEKIVEQLEKAEIQYFIFRIPSPVGKGMPQNKIFSTFIKESMNHERINIFGDGKRTQNYLDIRDLTIAINLSLESSCSGLYNIAGNEISDLQLAECCNLLFQSDSQIIVKNGCNKSEQWILSKEKANDDFGYSPCFSIRDSIKFVAEGII